MPFLNSVLRRYTPPTCTLEIMAKSSPLSHWMGQQVLKQLRFQLSFDDPRVPEEKRLTVWGDRDQLEILYDAVTTYVQQLLNQSPDRFHGLLSASDTPGSSPLRQLESNSDDVEAEISSLPEESQPPNPSQDTPSVFNLIEPAAVPVGKIFLHPGHWFTHNLILGSLANEETGPAIQLSMLQLFDMASALDEYSTDVMALPTLNTKSTTIPAWGKIAAVALLSIGLTTAVVRVINRSAKTNTHQNPNPSPSQIALQPSSLPVPTTPSLNAPDPLTAPPPLGGLPSAGPSTAAGVTLPSKTTQTGPGALGKNGLRKLPNPSNTAPNNSQQTFTIGSTPSQGTIPQTHSGTPIFQTGPGLASTRRDTTNSRQTPLQKNRATSSSSYPPIAVPPNPAPITLPPANSTPGPLPSLSPENPNSDQLSGSNSPSKIPRGAATTNKPGGTVFDTSPQVAEARDFFKKRWNPPQSLTEDLEYNLDLNVDGSIQRITPLGAAARKYVDSTGMPLIGEPFVSPNTSGKSTTIRVRLSPDGKVQTFTFEQ